MGECFGDDGGSRNEGRGMSDVDAQQKAAGY